MTFKNEFFRKLIHLSSVWIIIFIALTNQSTSIVFFAGLLLAFTVFEYLRMSQPAFSTFMLKYFAFVMRDREKTEKFEFRALTGSFYFILSILICLLIFDKSIVMVGVMVMIFSDAFAALIGKSVGRHKIERFNKTIEGCAAFFITTIIILYFMTSMPITAMAVIATIVTMVELISFEIHVNDNLSITLLTCGLIWMTGFIL